MPDTPTTYADGRRLLDADSHLMELPDFLTRHADPKIRDRIPPIDYSASSFRPQVAAALLEAGGLHAADYVEELCALGGPGLMRGPKEEKALGSFVPADRSRALDLLGFECQLLFSTLSGRSIFDDRLEPEVQYGATRSHNRAVEEFCADEARLLPVLSVPLRDAGLACTELDRALEAGARAVWVPHKHCGGRSPGHPDLDPFWARLEEAGVPFVLHVGGFKLQLPREWANDGKGPAPDFMGGGENVRGKDMIALHHSVERFLGTLVLDGVLERFPRLRAGAIELGAGWLPSMLTRLDSIAGVFGRNDASLRMERKPSEQLLAQFAATPFPFEDVGALVAQSHPDLYLFSSDYPHTEGGRDPLGRFDASLQSAAPAVRDRFFFQNFERVFGVPA